MADSDEDSIWIDVRPRLDDSAADEAVGKLRGKFDHVGDTLKDSLGGVLDSLGDHLGGPGGFGDKMHDMLAGAFTGKELDNLAHNAGTALGSGIHDAIGDALHGNFGNILGDFDRVGNVLAGALDKLSSKLDSAQKFGDAAGNVLSGNGTGDDVTNILGSAKDFGIHMPGWVGGAELGKEVIDKMNEHPGKTEDWLSSNIPGLGVLDNVINKGPQKAGDWVHNQVFGAGGGPSSLIPKDWTLEDSFAKDNPGFEAGGIGNAGSMSASMSTQTMDVSAGTVVLGGNISIPGVAPSVSGASGHPASLPSSLGGAGSSGGIPSAPASGGSGLGHAGSFSGLGFDQGGVLPGGSPGHDNILGSAGGHPVGLEGGEFVVNPQATQQNMGALNAINSGGSAGPNFNDPNSGGPQQQQQMGTGSGFGLTGSGLIGLAESLPGMAGQAAASGAGGMGAGAGAGAAAAVAQALWQNIGQPELNEAISKGGQLAATAAMAPIETGWLGGGQMGAPTVGSPAQAGWTGKLLGSLMGSQFSMPNVAGAVQPPKDPSQQQDQKDSVDPGAAGKAGSGKQGAGQGEHPSGPSGHQDDPIHVQPVGGGNKPPPGGNTSQLSGGATMASLGV